MSVSGTPSARHLLMRNRFERLRRIPLFPLIPIVPALIVGGTFVLSLLSFVRVRKLSRTLAEPATA